MRGWTGLVFGVGVLAGGCAATPLPALEDEPRIAALQAPALPVRMAVGWPKLALAEPGEHAGLVEWPAAAVQAALVDACTAAGLCADVQALPLGGGAEAALDAAWAQRADLVCEVTVRRARVGYVATNGWYLPNLVLWGLWIWPAWFVPDEDYDLQLETELRVRAVATGRELWRETCTARVQQSFDDFDRGIVLLGALRVPGALDESNWRAVSGVLLPPTQREWQLTVAERLAAGLRRVHDTAAYRDATRQTLAVVVGCGRYGAYEFHNLRHAADDARGVAAWLQAAGVGARNLRLLVDDGATTARIEAALSEFVAARAHAGDRVIFYYAGYAGTDRAGHLALLPYDADPNDTRGLPLARLAELLRGVEGADVLCVVDAGLGGGHQERWAGLGRAAPAVADARFELARVAERPRTALIWACGPGEGAAEVSDRGHGLLTANWLDAIRNATDADGDGVVSVAEACRELAEGVQTQALLAGRTQSPAVFGAEAAAAMAVPRATGEDGTTGGGA